MFLNYIQSDKKKSNIQQNCHGVLVRMPQIVLMIGGFEEKEIKSLENSLKKHFPMENYAFWLCVGNAAVSAAHFRQYKISFDGDSYLNIRSKYTDAVQNDQFISFCEESVADIFNSTSNLLCQEAGGVYLSVICKADQAGAAMTSPIVRKYRELLSEQFSMVYIDLYIFLDQSAYRVQKTEREASVYSTLMEAEDLVNQKTVRLAYVLSNIDSKGRLRDVDQVLQEQYESIALMISIKNLISNNSEYRYTDTGFGKSVVDFSQERAVETGKFSSVGHMHLRTDEEFIRLVSYLTVWDKIAERSEVSKMEGFKCELGIEKTQIRQYFSSACRMRNIDETDFDSIIRNRTIDERSVYTMTNGAAVDKFFGKNLSLFYELNVQNKGIEQRISDWHDSLEQKLGALPSDISNFDIYHMLKDLEDIIMNLADEAESFVEARKLKLSKWENMLFSSHSQKGKNINPLFELAISYIGIRNEVFAALQQKIIYDDLLRKVKDLNTYYCKFKNLVNGTIESLQEIIKEKENAALKPGNGLGLLQVTNARKYYSNVTTDLTHEVYFKEFKQLTEKMRQKIVKREFDDATIFQMVVAYCDKKLFTDQAYQIDFFKELQDRLVGYEDDGKWEIKTGTDVSNFLLTTIIDEQHTLFYDCIHQGFQTYEEMCLFLSNDSIFMEERDRDAYVANTIREQKMKLFCDKNSQSLDVIFIAGNLKAQNLHKWRNYEESYKKLMENV